MSINYENTMTFRKYISIKELKSNWFLVSFLIFFTACNQNEPELIMKKDLDYPNTKKIEFSDTYFETQIEDPYRWLEDDLSEETESWVIEQNKVTFKYLDQIPYKRKIQKKIEELWDYEKYSSPFKEGDYIYFYKNDGLQDQSVLYRRKDDKESEVFLDPNKFSKDGSDSLSGISFSTDGSLAAYSVSEDGSDWRKIYIIDTETKKQIEKPIVDVKFSGISWKGNEGFFYSSYPKPKGSELSAKTDSHRLYFHKTRSNQKDDKVYFGEKIQEKRRYVGGYVTEDDRYLIIQGANSTSGNDLYLIDLNSQEKELVQILSDMTSDTYLLNNNGTTLYLSTNRDAPNQKIVKVDANSPRVENWVDLVPETENVLSPSTGSNYIFAEYMIDANSKIFQYDFEGKLIREIELPGIGSAGAISGKKEDEELYYTFTNYITPPSIYKLNPKNGETEIYKVSSSKFDPEKYISNQYFFKTKDGTDIPITITHKKEIKLDGSNPTILYGYGGFNISLTPQYSITSSAWLEMGGIYAVANLRGGGEYGKEWHLAGTKLNKQNVFDDFIYAAEYLKKQGYTSKEKLAIMGRSNGGLLVGAVMTQKPDIAKVALPGVGVLDMLRYHKFTAGAGWAYDYGTSDESQEMFEYLLGYSPLHNISKGVSYPATLVTTGDHDDRVVPAHSFKFAAELQSKHKGDNPVLIRIEVDAGHGAGTPTSKLIEQFADIYAFTLFNMGYGEIN